MLVIAIKEVFNGKENIIYRSVSLIERVCMKICCLSERIQVLFKPFENRAADFFL